MNLTDISSSSVEITQLCDALEEMAQAVASSIETMQERDCLRKLLLEQENENLKKDELLAQSELKRLQNQINPHFLFNTLNMIYRMSLKEGADDAADMLMRRAPAAALWAGQPESHQQLAQRAGDDRQIYRDPEKAAGQPRQLYFGM